jgi:hydrogenase maturation protein HypF
VWGGELLFGGLEGFERVGLLFPVRMPGGDAAAHQPWRMACSWLTAAFDEPPALPAVLEPVVPDASWRQVAGLVRTGMASPVTTSAGRLFDAVAALCGIRAEVTYEGQAAIELEATIDPDESGSYPLPLRDEGSGPLILDARPAIRAVMDDLDRGEGVPLVAARFHSAMAAATAAGCAMAAERCGTGTVVLSGGVFQNRRLLAGTSALLQAGGLRVLTPERLPPNDGGIAYGQLAVAAARIAAEDEAR